MVVEGETSNNVDASGSSGVVHTGASRGDIEETEDATAAIVKDDAEMQAAVSGVQRVVRKSEGAETHREQLDNWATQSSPDRVF